MVDTTSNRAEHPKECRQPAAKRRVVCIPWLNEAAVEFYRPVLSLSASLCGKF
jgi:hypothetical protein